MECFYVRRSIDVYPRIRHRHIVPGIDHNATKPQITDFIFFAGAGQNNYRENENQIPLHVFCF